MRPTISFIQKISPFTSFIGLIAIIVDFGFYQNRFYQEWLDTYYFLVLGIGLIATSIRYTQNPSLRLRKVFYFDFSLVIFILWLFYLYIFVGIPFETDFILENPIWIKIAVILSFIREFSELRINYKRTVLNPAQLFIASFFAIILLGAILLMLPRASHTEISFLDALFTSTSAVCVTGLAVVDTGSHFTTLGQTILVILIQIGGLGILTFASYFSYFFKGGTSYENQLVLSDMTSSRKLGEVFSLLKYIILITFIIELSATILIFSSLDSKLFSSWSEQLFFSAFHAISAFCNAGFSTLSTSLYDDGFRYNYYLQIVVIATFVLGGLGFPIVVNIMKYAKYLLLTIIPIKKTKFRPWVLNLDSRITLITTCLITLIGFVAFYFLEYHNTLAEHRGIGKAVTALFGATTPRTAGFNSIDFAATTMPTILLIILLMWIGASPQSTGGGIKTSTFAIATLNILSLAKGKTRIEVFRREISDLSVRRAFATIALSLIIIGFGISFVSYFDPQMSFRDIAFECFSAYSTVGLSLGITSSLSAGSKWVLIVIMFIGRISMLSLVIAVFTKVRHKNYRYPTEELTIN